MPLAFAPATPIPGLRPQLQVQVAFTTDPNSAAAATPTWTTLANRVLQADFTTTSRDNELGAYQAGEATISLHNPDGMFNPVNTSGPYYGLLKLYRPIRIVATWDDVDYPLWQGYVERWPQKWSDPVLGISEIECVDAFALAAQIGLDSCYAAEVLLDNPTVYYPCGEDEGATTAGNASGNPFPPAQIVHTKKRVNATPGTYAFGADLAVVGAAAQTGVQFTGTNSPGGAEDGYALQLPRVPIIWVGWTVEFWCEVPVTPDQVGVLFISQDTAQVRPQFGPGAAFPSGFIEVEVWNLSTGAGAGQYLNVTVATPDGGYIGLADFIDNVADGKLHHVVLTWTGNTLQVYLDGVAGGGTTASPPSTTTATTQQLVQVGAGAINSQTLPGGNFDGAPLIGTVGQVAIYPSALNAGRILSHYTAGSTAFAGEVTGLRQQRLAAYGGWRSFAQSFEYGLSTLSGATGIAGTSLLQALQDAADAELGTLTVNQQGQLDGRSRFWRMYQTAPSIVFGSTGAPGEIPYDLSSLQFDYDPAFLANDVQISRPNGITAEAADATSIQEYFPRVKQLTMNVDSDDQAQQAASWILGREREPSQHLEALSVDAGSIDASTLTGLWPSLLSLGLHQRARVAHHPMGAPDIITDGFVELVQHQIDASAGTWRITTGTSPILADYWIVDDPVQGRVDSTFQVAF